MSGSFSSGLLDSLAKPAQVNYLDVVDKASKAALYINEARKTQAQQLAGEAQLNAIDQNGVYQPNVAGQNLAAAGPGAALAAGATLESSQRLSDQQLAQAKAKTDWVNSAAGAALQSGDFSDSAMLKLFQNGVANGMLTMPEVQKQMALLPPDAAGRAQWLQEHQMTHATVQQQLDQTHGVTTTQTGPGGMTVPITTVPASQGRPASVTQGVGGAQQGQTQEDLHTLVNVPYPKFLPDGVTPHPMYGQTFPMQKGDLQPLLTTNPPGQQGAQSGATPTSVFKALVGTEGSGPDAVSPKGATGSAQIMEGTFNQYKLPGEKYGNEDDRVAAARRAVDDLWRKYPNDPARVAVGYFSGPDNVAPPGSPTPWIADKSDGTTSTSGYVRNFTSKLGVGTKVAGPGAGPTPAAAGGVPYGPPVNGQPPPGSPTRGATATPTPAAVPAPSATPTGAPAAPPAPAFGTAPSAADIELQKKQALQGAQGFQDISDQAVQSRNRSAILGNMLADTTSFTTGPLASRIEALRAIGNRLGMSVDTEGLTAQQSFNKLAAQLANAAGAGSDARLSVNVAANPHQELSPGAVDLMLRQLQGNEDYVQTRARLAAIYPNKKDVSAFENEKGLRMDPRAFQYARMTPGEQRQTYKAQLEKSGDLGTVQRSYNWLHNQGLVGD